MHILRAALAGGLAAAGLAAGFAAGGASAVAPRPGVTERVSVSSAGAQGNDVSGDTVAPLAMTPDGRYVAFVSSASNLVPGDINQEDDVFVHDRRTGKTVMASVPSPGTVAKVISSPVPVLCPAEFPSISANGRYVAFATCRSLDGKAPDGGTDVWVHDFSTGATTRVSVTYDGTPFIGAARRTSISDDGRYIAFESNATNLVRDRCPGDTVTHEECAVLGLTTQEVYVRDMIRQTTILASVGTSGGVGDADAYNPAISADGHLVTFTSNSDNRVSNDHNICPLNQTPSCADVYARDLRTSKTELVSVDLNGQAAAIIPFVGEGADVSLPASVSADGRYVAFYTGQSELVPADAPVSGEITTGTSGVYVRDLKLGRTERESVTSSGTPLALGGGSATIDRTGRYVAFDAVEECGTGVATGHFSVAVHDRVTGDTRVLDEVDANGKQIPCPANWVSSTPVVGSGGRYVAFSSDSSMLVHGDTNKKFDVFVHDEGAALGVGSIVATVHAGRVGASAVYRPERHDLFVRLDVDAMLPLLAVAPSMPYAVGLTCNGQSYELRATDLAGVTSFAVFRQTSSGWRRLGAVPGGYGTTGQQVVAAIPLALIDATSPSDIQRIDVNAAGTSAPSP